MPWDSEQKFEANWWGDCANTLGEQFKHPTYARMMGMPFENDGGRYIIKHPGRSILDIGGGPCSMLLSVEGAARRTVVDPCPYPEWTRARYEAAGIEVIQTPAEDFVADEPYDEVLIYNVLQHVQNPEKIIANARKSARLLRMFEWVNEPPHEGHPHELKSELLAKWGGFDKGFWAEDIVEWDHYVGDHEAYYPNYVAFHGYVYL